MTQRATDLVDEADGQVVELIDLLAGADDVALRRSCVGREKLGDGTIAASALHAADNYTRIADFVALSARMTRRGIRHRPGGGGHSMRRGHSMRGGHGEQGTHDGMERYAAERIDRAEVLDQLRGTRQRVQRIAELSDRQLDSVPPKGAFRFCDGERSLEQVLTGLLKHQRHQLDALAAGLG